MKTGYNPSDEIVKIKPRERTTAMYRDYRYLPKIKIILSNSSYGVAKVSFDNRV